MGSRPRVRFRPQTSSEKDGVAWGQCAAWEGAGNRTVEPHIWGLIPGGHLCGKRKHTCKDSGAHRFLEAQTGIVVTWRRHCFVRLNATEGFVGTSLWTAGFGR